VICLEKNGIAQNSIPEIEVGFTEKMEI